MEVWQRMLSGRRLNLVDPSPLDIELEDIAHGLARVARWNGQTKGGWAMSVAEHSMLVERIAAAYKRGLHVRWRLAALLHDGPEYVVGDMIRPLKQITGRSRSDVEARLQTAINRRFGIPADLPSDVAELIKRADRASAYVEAIQLAGYSVEEANRLWGRPRLAMLQGMELAPMAPDDAATAFEARFTQLWGSG